MKNSYSPDEYLTFTEEQTQKMGFRSSTKPSVHRGEVWNSAEGIEIHHLNCLKNQREILNMWNKVLPTGKIVAIAT